MPARFDFDLTQPDPIPEAGIARATELMRSGRLFRYTEFGDEEVNDAAEVEARLAELVGRRYAVGVNSGGAAIFVALRACGVQPGDPVLLNGYTLAPVPRAVQHPGSDLRYEQHRPRSPMSVFEPLRGQVASYSLRMTALAAALIRPQLGMVPGRGERMNQLYRELETSWATSRTSGYAGARTGRSTSAVPSSSPCPTSPSSRSPRWCRSPVATGCR